MVDKITVPMARASILWLIGEYSERVPKIAPDVLRKLAKSFINEVRRQEELVVNVGSESMENKVKLKKILLWQTGRTVNWILFLSTFTSAWKYWLSSRSRFI